MKKIALIFVTMFQLSHAFAAGITWNSPSVRISSVGVDASNPQIGMDLNGDVFAVWVEDNFIKSSNLPLHSSAWSPISTLSQSGSSEPKLAVDQNGNTTAIWVENGLIKASTQPFGGAWNNPSTLSISGASAPQIAVDTNGNVVAAWVRNGFIESSTLYFGAEWPTAPNILSSRIADSPQISISDNGTVIVVWHSTISSIDTVLYSTKTQQGTWSPQAAISIKGIDSVYPKIALDASGNAVAIWFRYNKSNLSFSDVVVQAALFNSNMQWTTAVDISSSGIYNPALLTSNVAFDSQGNAVANWNTSLDGRTFNYEAAVLSKNGTWSQPMELVSSNLYADFISLAVDAKGHSQMLYMVYDSPSIDINACELDIFASDLEFSSPSTISSGSFNGFPQIATSINGNTIRTIGAWIFYNGSNNVIRAVRGHGTVFPPPTHLTVSQGSHNKHVLTEYFNTIRWTASAEPSTTGYLIYRNGVLIGQVSSSVLKFVDNNQEQDGSVVYGVSAINSDSQSTAAIINFN